MTSEPKKNDWTDDALATALIERRSGLTLKQMAASYGVSVERVRQVLAKAERIEKHRPAGSDMGALSTRLRNLLASEGLMTADAIRHALATGGLDNVPNLGPAAKKAIAEWLSGAKS